MVDRFKCSKLNKEFITSAVITIPQFSAIHRPEVQTFQKLPEKQEESILRQNSCVTSHLNGIRNAFVNGSPLAYE
jgi:hypothetical protein